MTKPRKGLQAHEREMLWGLDTAHRFDGWVVVGRRANGRLQPLPWTFRQFKAGSFERLLDFAKESHHRYQVSMVGMSLHGLGLHFEREMHDPG